MLQFTSAEQRLRLCSLLARARTNISDTRTLTFFYIVSAAETLYVRVDAIYNFVYRCPDRSCLYSGVIECGTQEWALLFLAFALYDEDFPADVSTVFSMFGNDTLEIALRAVHTRYSTAYPFI